VGRTRGLVTAAAATTTATTGSSRGGGAMQWLMSWQPLPPLAGQPGCRMSSSKPGALQQSTPRRHSCSQDSSSNEGAGVGGGAGHGRFLFS